MNKKKKLSDEYEKIDQISEGVCGDVVKGKNKLNGNIVALKRIKILYKEEGFPSNSFKEINYLRKLNHPNIIKLIDVVREDIDVYLVFEYFEFDLYGLLYGDRNYNFNLDQIKFLCKQLLSGIQEIHKNNIIHRDLKPANILISKNNVLKIIDFGIACEKPKNISKNQTNKVITIWYRPPELLLGSTKYGFEVDIWSVGCIIFEMITKNVLFRSLMDNEIEQLKTIFSICGLPNAIEWDNWKELPNSTIFLKSNNNNYINKLDNYLNKFIPENFKASIPFLIKMLCLNPLKRLTAEELLNDPFLIGNFNNLENINLPESHQKIPFNQIKNNNMEISNKRPKKNVNK